MEGGNGAAKTGLAGRRARRETRGCGRKTTSHPRRHAATVLGSWHRATHPHRARGNTTITASGRHTGASRSDRCRNTTVGQRCNGGVDNWRNGGDWSGRSGSSLRSGHVVSCREGLRLRNNIVLLALGGKSALSLVTVPLSLSVLLVCVVDCDGLAEQVLAIHGGEGSIRSFKRIEADEAVTLGDVVLVANDVWLSENLAELTEGVVKDLLINLGVEVVDEQFGADVDRLLLIRTGLVHAKGLAPDTDAVEDFCCIFGRSGGIVLDEAVTLVNSRNAIQGHMDLANRTDLGHELGQELLSEAFIDIADVDGRVFILLPVSFFSNHSCLLGWAIGRWNCSKVAMPIAEPKDVRGKLTNACSCW